MVATDLSVDDAGAPSGVEPSAALMMGPQGRREGAAACRVIVVDRSSVQYQGRRCDDDRLRQGWQCWLRRGGDLAGIAPGDVLRISEQVDDMR
jgi:hypothetical protein